MAHRNGADLENVALGATVTYEGGTLFNGPCYYCLPGGCHSLPASPVDLATIVDGVFLPPHHPWCRDTVWWYEQGGGHRVISIGLPRAYRIEAFTVQADDNDAYLLSYHHPESGQWLSAWNIPQGPPGLLGDADSPEC